MKKIILILGVCFLAFTLSTSLYAKQEVKLTFWTFMEVNKSYYENAAKQFSEENPDIELKLVATNYPYEEMHEKLLMAAISGVGAPDICDVEIGKIGFFLRGEIPFYDLTDLVSEYKDKLLDIRLKAFQYQGRQYAIPTHIGTGVVYYNTELFKKAGLSMDDIESWDDFISMGKKITKDTDGDGKSDIWMTDVETNDLHMIKVLGMQRGGGIYNDKGDMILDCQANIDALQFLQDLVYKHKIARIAPGGFHFDASYFPWVNEGNVAAVIHPQWLMEVLVNNVPDLYGKIVVRALPRVAPGGKRSGMSGGTSTTIMKQIDPEKLDIAKKFLAYSKLTYAAQKLIWTEMGYDPYRMDVYDDPDVLAPLPYFSNESVASLIKDLWYNNDIPSDNMGAYYPEVLELLRESIPYRAFQNKEDPATILKEAAAEVRAKAGK